MATETIEQARNDFPAADQVAAVNDLISRIAYSHRHEPQNCPAGLPAALPAGAGAAEIATAYQALEAIPFQQLVRGLCEPMKGAFPSERVVRVLTRSFTQGAELERRYRTNTGVAPEA